MMIGVAVTLSAVAIITVFFRVGLVRLLAARPRPIEGAAKILEAVAGLVLVAIAFNEIL